MKKRYHLFILGICIASSTLFTSCEDDHDDHDHDHENELITTARLTFTNTVNNKERTFKWSQPAGPGTAITADTISLPIDSTFNVSVVLLDESKSSAFDATPEIRKYGNEHQFFYTSGTGRLVISNRDNDSKNMPLGLAFTAQTSTNGSVLGTLRCVLKHYTSAAPKSIDPQAGSTDMDVTFPVKIQ